MRNIFARSPHLILMLLHELRPLNRIERFMTNLANDRIAFKLLYAVGVDSPSSFFPVKLCMDEGKCDLSVS